MSLARDLADGVINGLTPQPSNMQPFNRIINGAMTVDQRNAGATLTLSGSSQFAVDRFVASKDTAGATCTAQRSTTSTTGFVNSLLWTTTTGATSGVSDESVIWQNIEGYNVADLAWGTALATTVTLSFWVRSSLTGTFGVSFRSPSGSRNYVGSYTINSANTFEYKTVTVAGDTTGTWATDNSTGLRITWDMGCGTSKSTTAGSWGAGNLPGLTGGVKVSANTGATFYITGVQLEAGSFGSSFAHENYGDTLRKCQRYYSLLAGGGACGTAESNSASSLTYQFPVPMRATPTGTLNASKGSLSQPYGGPNSVTTMTSFFFGTTPTAEGGWLVFVMSNTPWTSGRIIINNGTTGMIQFSAEL